MKVGVLTGTGTYALPGFESASPETVATRFGEARVTRGAMGEVEVLHVSRHGEGHRRLSNHVTHRGNIAALRDLGADCVLAVTVCGAVDPSVPLASLVVFDDLHFLANRLADGSLCTLYDETGAPDRGHWIYECPFSERLREALREGCREAGVRRLEGECLGHMYGPVCNTRGEILTLYAAGVTGLWETAGPE